MKKSILKKLIKEIINEAKNETSIDVDDPERAIKDLKKLGLKARQTGSMAININTSRKVAAEKLKKWMIKNQYDDMEELYPELYK